MSCLSVYLDTGGGAGPELVVIVRRIKVVLGCKMKPAGTVHDELRGSSGPTVGKEPERKISPEKWHTVTDLMFTENGNKRAPLWNTFVRRSDGVLKVLDTNQTYDGLVTRQRGCG